MNYKRKNLYLPFHQVSFLYFIFYLTKCLYSHARNRFLMHIVNYNHRNLSTLRGFMHDVLLLESHGSSLVFCLLFSLADDELIPFFSDS